MSRPRVLMLTHRVPWPPDRGDRVRSWHVLREMSGWAEVWLASVDREGEYSAEAREVLEGAGGVCERVHVEGVSGGWQRGRAAVRGALGLWKGSATAGVLREPGLVRVVRGWLEEARFDWVYVFCSGMWGVVAQGVGDRVWGVGEQDALPKLWVDLVDVDSAKWRGLASWLPWWHPQQWLYAIESARIEQVEREIWAYVRGNPRGIWSEVKAPPADGPVIGGTVSVISVDELRRLVRVLRPGGAAFGRALREGKLGSHTLGWGRVLVMGNGVDVKARPALADAGSKTVVFVGVLDYGPNVEAVRWLAERVWPRVLAEEPGAVLRVVGRSPGKDVERLGLLPGVEIIGPVEDVVEGAYRGAVAASAPLRVAPGVQNKVLEAMACGRAVVCSSAAAAGIEAAPGRELLVADDEAEHAAVLVRLMRDAGWRLEIAAAGRARVERSYGWSARLAVLREVMGGGSV
ncbi:MAG: glycosyltransferase [Planctomycetota bacterium]